MTPSVLMVVYYFPPQGSVQVLRALKFAKYLPEFGWKPVILSVKDILHYYNDPDLIKELPDSVKILRTGSLDPFRLMTILKNLTPRTPLSLVRRGERGEVFFRFRNAFNELNRWLALPDSRFGWYPFAVSQGKKAIKNRGIKMIYSSSPPNIAHLVALKLHQETGLPWIADFKDMWADYPHSLPTQWHRRKMQKWEEKIVTHASRVITINPAITNDFQKRYPSISQEHFQTLVHGYDPFEFSGLVRQPPSKFTIVHTGSFFEPRQIADYFFKAISELLLDKPEMKDKIEIILVGTLTNRQKALMDTLQLTSIIKLVGSVNRRESIQHQINADVLLLLVGEGYRSELVLPAKTWEYLASGRPILCMAPPGVTTDLIRKHNAGIVVLPQDVTAIKKTIQDFYRQYSAHTLSPTDSSAYSQYDRRKITGELANLFTQCLTQT
jgi:glycosyltransferase involved in cell wall biosynthesis